MKSAVGPFLAAVALALAGAAFWIAGQTDNRLADVHKQLAMLRYADAASEGDDFEQSLGVERRVPILGATVDADVRDVRAEAGYWKSDYASVAPRKDANGVVTESDPAILLLAANAAFRGAQNSDRLTAVRRLDEVVRSYAEVLKTQAKACDGESRACDARATDAAFNYEYAIRTRDALAKSRPPAAKTPAKAAAAAAARAVDDDLPAGPTLHGRPGGPPPATDMNQFKIVIPKRGEERKDAPDAGKGGQKIRKG
jgi:hypothetical protein